MLDVWGHIISFIDCDKPKCNLLLTCKWISKCDFHFNQKISIRIIRYSRWFDKFTNIIIPMKMDMIKLPLSVTRLEFGDRFNKSLKKYIPSTVTHLKFGDRFNQPINNCIPSSVTHLKFGHDYDQSIKNCIPSSVTHLNFGHEFDQHISNNIPSSVTHLKLGYWFSHSIRNLPTSIIYLKISFRDDVPKFIKNVEFYNF